MRVLDARWIKKDGKLLINYIDENKSERFVAPRIKPYFFLRSNDVSNLEKVLSGFEYELERGDYVTIDGYRAVKVSVEFPDQVRSLRDRIEKKGYRTYESDIPFIKRWMIDEGIRQAEIERRAYIDVECDSRAGFPNPSEASARIISIAVVFDDGEEHFISEEDECELLRQFWELLRRKAYMVTAWNLKNFDWPYLINRTKRVGLGPQFVGVQELDTMHNFQKILSWNVTGLGLKLEVAAEHFLGIKKLGDFESKQGVESLYQSFVTDKTLLKEYNLRDAKLVAALDQTLKLADPYIELSYVVPCMLRDVVYVSQLVDSLVLEEALSRSPRIVFLRKERKRADLKGGCTLEPKPGVHKNVLVCDFKALYNSIMQTFLLSPEVMCAFRARTGREEGGEIDENFVREYLAFAKTWVLEGRGYPIFPTILERVEKRRDNAKKQRDKYPEGSPEYVKYQLEQLGWKLILVSTYGATGHEDTRFFDADVVNATTFIGRWILKKSVEAATALDYEILYGDTDSIFVKCSGEPLLSAELLPLAIEKEIAAAIRESFGETNSKIKVEAKCVYSHLLLTDAKKIYFGRIVWEEGHKTLRKEVKGAQMKRSDSFELLRKVQDKIVELFFEYADSHDILEEKLREYREEIKRKLYTGELDSLLVLTKSVRQDLTKYQVTQPHVRVALKLREQGLYRPGDPVRWVIVAEGVEEPVIGGKIPQITASGYKYYWTRIEQLFERMTRAIRPERNASLKEYTSD